MVQSEDGGKNARRVKDSGVVVTHVEKEIDAEDALMAALEEEAAEHQKGGENLVGQVWR